MTTTIITEKMICGGDCIGKIAGKTILIPFSIPGERLSIEITEMHRDYNTARIVQIQEPSSHRVRPACPLYGICGGCNTMHIDISYQKELRMSILKDCFIRCNINIPSVTAISGPDLCYRSRFQLTDGGFAMRGTNKIIPATSCPVAENAINNWFAAVPPEKRMPGRTHLFGSVYTEDIVTSATLENKIEEKETVQTTNSSRHKAHNKVKKHFSGTVPLPDCIAHVNILDKKINFDVRGFFQSNLFVLEKALPAICETISGTNVLDMYSGCGTFSVFLADHFDQLTLVEHNRDALVFAEQNIAGKKHSSYGMSGAKWVEQCSMTAPRFDAVIIDPPRSGMEKEVCNYLCKKTVPVIHSLSCNPATQARDVAYLVAAGYHLESLTLLDFYPQTSHIESLAVLTHDI
jgi:23S rRNA (uracil1939-C5)-methyltransferase